MPAVNDLPAELRQPIVFVDLETTGATATVDRISEVGIVELADGEVRRWSSLVNPGCRISDFITRLTGISNDMVADAPPFEAIAHEVAARLHGRLFVAHNARFDYGFLKNEFKRCGIDFRATVLCSVKLSRRLYPAHHRHSLDALIERHGLEVSARHRALGDADLIRQFWHIALAEHPPVQVASVLRELTARPSLPPHLDPDLIDQIPEGHGVYLFYGENELPLYIGKSKTLKKRVLAHFAADHASAKEMSLSQQVRRIDWQETTGELGALLLESRLVKQLLPTHNRQLRRQNELCTWHLAAGDHPRAPLSPRLTWAADLPPGLQADCYGLFKSQREAQKALKALADEHQLCHALLGLEKVRPGLACFGVQIRTCRGACAGKEDITLHNGRLLAALGRLKLKTWPYAGPVALREGETLHVIDHWRHLGSARDESELAEILTQGRGAFDADTYKLLIKHLGKLPVEKLSRPTNPA